MVDTEAGLEDAAAALDGAPRLYIDTEFESSREGTRLSLLQVSRGERIFVVDALRLKKLGPLRGAVAQGRSEWVLHAGLQDVKLLVERFGMKEPPPVFDTQVGWGLVGPEASVSLGYLEYRVLGIRKMKTHQAADWMRRPIPAAQLRYAAGDIEHLPAIRDAIGARASALGREHLVIEASREQIWPEPEEALPLTLDSFRNAWQLDPPSQAALRSLIDWHRSLPKNESDGGPSPKTFLAIASRLPETRDELRRIKGVPGRWASRHGEKLCRRLARAAAESAQRDLEPIEPPPYATFDEIRLDGWLASMRAEVCASLSVAPDIALPARVMRRLRARLVGAADRAQGVEILTGWRRELVGEAYLKWCSAA